MQPRSAVACPHSSPPCKFPKPPVQLLGTYSRRGDLALADAEVALFIVYFQENPIE